MMFLQVTFSFHFSNFVLDSFLSCINACHEGVKLELYFVLQAIEHCMEHIGVFGKESGVYTYVIDHRLFERTVQKAVFSGKIIRVHVASF